MAEELKKAGNAAFAAKNFVRAHGLYSEAIALDGHNAVLYANRCACSYGMGRYVDTLRDASRATEIDPGYPKGWSRLATAHEAALEFESAVVAWTRALSALPKENPTETERKQRDQYVASLDKAKARLAAAQPPPPGIIVVSDTPGEKAPWQLAEEMMPELQAAGQSRTGPPSSAYLIYYANQEWEAGVNHMKTLKKIPTGRIPDEFQVVGHTAGLTSLTNGLMRDIRVFRLDCPDWIQIYNDQLCFEAQTYKAWTKEPLETIKQESLKRLKKEGWDSLRPALAVVVRSWIMRAVIDSQLRQAPHMAVERLHETLQLLHWGRQVWRDVHKDDRGVIFMDAFVRGVKSLHIRSLMEAHAKATSADKQAIMNTLLREAREMIEEVGKMPRPTGPNPDEPLDPGFFSSFYTYPLADTNAAVGYCFMHVAATQANPIERAMSYAMAIKHYMCAYRGVPEDDEKHVWYMHRAIQAKSLSGIPDDSDEAIANGVRARIPEAQRIWANSALAKQGRDAMIETVLRDTERAAAERAAAERAGGMQGVANLVLQGMNDSYVHGLTP